MAEYEVWVTFEFTDKGCETETYVVEAWDEEEAKGVALEEASLDHPGHSGTEVYDVQYLN